MWTVQIFYMKKRKLTFTFLSGAAAPSGGSTGSWKYLQSFNYWNVQRSVAFRCNFITWCFVRIKNIFGDLQCPVESYCFFLLLFSFLYRSLCCYFFKDKNLITVKMNQTHEREKTMLCIQTQSQASTQVEITADIWWKHLDIRCKFCFVLFFKKKVFIISYKYILCKRLLGL